MGNKSKLNKVRKKRKNNTKNNVFAILRIVGLIMPIAIYVLFTCFLFPTPNSVFLIFGFAGAFLIGVGLILAVGVLEKIYPGHVIMGIPIGLGVILIGISIYFLYFANGYGPFEKAFTDYYFLVWIFLALSAFWYMLFRMSITKWLRHNGVSNTRIKKLREGKQNYWWYEALHREINLGAVYTLNKVFTILFVIIVCLHTFAGWWKPVSPVTVMLYCVICLENAAMQLFTTHRMNMDEFGNGFVLLAHKGKHKKWYGHSSLTQVGFVIFPILSGASLVIYSFSKLF